MKTRIAHPGEGVSEAVALLDAGGLVALPTETVYGLGASALDGRACAGIFEAKGRPLSDPLIVHVPDLDWSHRIAEMPPVADRLARRFWPGPLTLVLPRRSPVPDIVTAGQPTVAVRWSAHPVFSQVAMAFGRPIAAPSANRFGRISPTTAAHVIAELDGKIPLVLDGGPCVHGVESTIVQISGDELVVLRHGPVTVEDLSEFGHVRSARPGDAAAPGGLKSHYAPATPVRIVDVVPPARPGIGLLTWQADGQGYETVERLTGSGDLREAAANLYAALRRLDEAGLEEILAEVVPLDGLGTAIMDRLRKAAAR